MIQTLRENLKGALAIVLIGFILLAMLVTGQEMVKTTLSDTVAKVNGTAISEKDLRRAMMLAKARMQEQMKLEDTAEQLKDENLRQPALNSLIREKALVLAAQKGGMGVSDATVKDQIKQSFSQNNAFQAEQFNYFLNRNGYTQASLIEQESGLYVLRQLMQGLSGSAFVTASEVDLLAAIVGQKRNFTAITLPYSLLDGKIKIADEEAEQYYKDNQARFTEEQKISVQYIALFLDDLAKLKVPTDEQIKASFEEEQKNFVSTPELIIAHILVDAKTEKAAAQKRIDDIKVKLASGESFESLAKTQSDDLGSKDAGGVLGVMTGDLFPADFQASVSSLTEGQVSAPLTSPAGTHFVKLLKRTTPVAPSFETRKAIIQQQLAKEQAAEHYADDLKRLDELTFGKDSLEAAAQALGLEVKTSALFARSGGADIAAQAAVVEAAFAKDVLEQGQNSKVIEVGSDKAYVVRLKDNNPSHVKPLAEVKPSVVAALTQAKITSELQAKAGQLQQLWSSGGDIAALVKKEGYIQKTFTDAERFKSAEDREVVQWAFSMVPPAPNQPQLGTFTGHKGDVVVISLTAVQKGSRQGLDPQQLDAMKAQVENQQMNDELVAYEQAQFSAAKVKR